MSDTYTIKHINDGNLSGWYLIIRFPEVVLDPTIGRSASAKYKISGPAAWEEINALLLFFGMQELVTA